MAETKHAINHDWDEYYICLEVIRRSGITNMYGASPYLAELCGISQLLAIEVLVNWIENYNELSAYFKWREKEELKNDSAE